MAVNRGLVQEPSMAIAWDDEIDGVLAKQGGAHGA